MNVGTESRNKDNDMKMRLKANSSEKWTGQNLLDISIFPSSSTTTSISTHMLAQRIVNTRIF